MASAMRSLIKYKGITPFPKLYNTYFKLFNNNNILELSSNVPPVGELMIVSVHSTIDTYELINSYNGVSLSGYIGTGHKLFVSGHTELTLHYTSSEESPYMHSFSHNMNFSEYIPLPKNASPTTHFTPLVTTLDIYAYPLSNQHIYHNLTLLVTTKLS